MFPLNEQDSESNYLHHHMDRINQDTKWTIRDINCNYQDTVIDNR